MEGSLGYFRLSDTSIIGLSALQRSSRHIGHLGFHVMVSGWHLEFLMFVVLLADGSPSSSTARNLLPGQGLRFWTVGRLGLFYCLGLILAFLTVFTCLLHWFEVIPLWKQRCSPFLGHSASLCSLLLQFIQIFQSERVGHLLGPLVGT